LVVLGCTAAPAVPRATGAGFGLLLFRIAFYALDFRYNKQQEMKSR
jgi:hypothetical protein